MFQRTGHIAILALSLFFTSGAFAGATRAQSTPNPEATQNAGNCEPCMRAQSSAQTVCYADADDAEKGNLYDRGDGTTAKRLRAQLENASEELDSTKDMEAGPSQHRVAVRGSKQLQSAVSSVAKECNRQLTRAKSVCKVQRCECRTCKGLAEKLTVLQTEAFEWGSTARDFSATAQSESDARSQTEQFNKELSDLTRPVPGGSRAPAGSPNPGAVRDRSCGTYGACAIQNFRPSENVEVRGDSESE